MCYYYIILYKHGDNMTNDEIKEYRRNWQKAHPYSELPEEEKEKRRKRVRDWMKKTNYQPPPETEERRKKRLETIRAWQKRNPEKVSKSSRKYLLKKRFSSEITPDLYEELYEKQHGKCAICGISKIELGKHLSIDHDHKTGEIRGLLCNRCNMALGGLNENVVSMLRMIDYVNGTLKFH